MVTIKHKVTIRTKIPPAPSPTHLEEPKRGLKVWILAVVVLIAAIVMFLCYKKCINKVTPAAQVVEKNETSASKKQEKKQSLPLKSPVSNPTTQISGNLEENARQVIRGVFGNGQERKDKLGSAYSEIQGRVNEMYRQGLVH